jgi:hypothetical protein
MRRVDLHLAAFGQHLDSIVDYCGRLPASISEFRNGDLERGVVAADEIDMGFDLAILRDLVGRGFDLRVRQKSDPEGTVGIAVFLPILRRGAEGDRSARRE